MRKLNIEDMYLLSRIADKIDFKIPNVEGKSKEQVGADLLADLFKSMHKAKDEINELIESLQEPGNVKKANEMSIKEIKDFITQLLSDNDVIDFFK